LPSNYINCCLCALDCPLNSPPNCPASQRVLQIELCYELLTIGLRNAPANRIVLRNANRTLVQVELSFLQVKLPCEFYSFTNSSTAFGLPCSCTNCLVPSKRPYELPHSFRTYPTNSSALRIALQLLNCPRIALQLPNSLQNALLDMRTISWFVKC
jgi:hypothetical protein